MKQSASKPRSSATEGDSPDEMAKYGIIKKSTEHFYCGEYRYTNLRDAMAQAKRVAAETARTSGDTSPT